MNASSVGRSLQCSWTMVFFYVLDAIKPFALCFLSFACQDGTRQSFTASSVVFNVSSFLLDDKNEGFQCFSKGATEGDDQPDRGSGQSQRSAAGEERHHTKRQSVDSRIWSDKLLKSRPKSVPLILFPIFNSQSSPKPRDPEVSCCSGRSVWNTAALLSAAVWTTFPGRWRNVSLIKWKPSCLDSQRKVLRSCPVREQTQPNKARCSWPWRSLLSSLQCSLDCCSSCSWPAGCCPAVDLSATQTESPSSSFQFIWSAGASRIWENISPACQKKVQLLCVKTSTVKLPVSLLPGADPVV